MSGPQLVRNDATGEWGVYHPGRDVIETRQGRVVVEIDEYQVSNQWREAGQEEFYSDIESGIDDLKSDIEELRLLGADLGRDQREEMCRIVSRIESYETLLDVVREVDDDTGL